ncbi:single-stranded DNA-binding protein [Arsukibacterium indicum]|uniref:Single-stranded DNA-binding protein n=1 Tax=Arsukibacterium indicum TaxID=2848612 RepID=A0ABS6MHV6_9GAMM|nr:single-stranded DNA-binding protein [Arsukibacterium indicum]MBV2128205.1 single-stranded DNA-binding protein [Arsukibacterium indicum]
MSKGTVNKVIIIGNLGADPEVRYATSGAAICNMTVATSESWTDKNTNEKKEQTEWHRVVIYQRLAEIAGDYLRKGSKVYLEGKLKTRKWTDKDGIERFTTEIVANELQMLDGKQDGQSTTSQPSKPQQQRPAQQTGGYQSSNQRQQASINNAPPLDFDQDIPF